MSTRVLVQVWDLPIRLFHWLLVMSIASLWVTAEVIEDFQLHSKIGLFVVGLLTFRVIYGFIGGSTAKFSQFVKGRVAILSYVQGNWKGIGHNPLGALSVLALLGLSLLTVSTGLFANNEGDFSAPLAFLVSTDTSDFFNGIHELFFNLLLAVIGLHIVAIVIYKRFFSEDLVKPMLLGHTEVEAEIAQTVQPAKTWAIILSLGVALLAVWGASGLWHQPPAKPAAVSSPDW